MSALTQLRGRREPSEGNPLASVAARIKRIPFMRPTEYYEEIRKLGYRGQPAAVRAAATLLYRHVRRLRRLCDGETVRGNRENVLFIGPTGAGKTFLVECLASITGLPSVCIDITQFSETGYMGDDVAQIPARLINAADGDVAWAQCGIICIDELDKLAASRSSARFAGEGTTKDVSGYGVQRGLLALLSSPRYTCAAEYGGRRDVLPMQAITLIACGAFSGLKGTAASMQPAFRIGFHGDGAPREREAIAVSFGSDILENTAAFAEYGILPELLGRFTAVIPFEPLETETLRGILDSTLVTQYREEFESEGLSLRIEDSVFDAFVQGAIRRETGARGLQAAMAPYLSEAAYECFGGDPGATVRLTLEDARRIVVKVE